MIACGNFYSIKGISGWCNPLNDYRILVELPFVKNKPNEFFRDSELKRECYLRNAITTDVSQCLLVSPNVP